MLVKVAKILVKLSGGDYNTLLNIVNSNDIDSFYQFFKNDDFINEYGTISNREINYLFNNFYDASKLMHEYYEKRSKGIDGKKIYLKTPKDFTAKKSNAYNGDIKNRIKNFIIERCGENYKIVKGDMLDFICDDDRFYSQLIDNNDRINNPITGKCYIGAKYDNMSLVMECDEETYPIKCYMSSLTYKILKNDYNKISESKNMSKKMTDRMLLESLVNKYGVKRLTNVINKMNENSNDNTIKMPLRRYLQQYFGVRTIADLYDEFMATDFDPDSLDNNFDGDYDAQWKFLRKHLNDIIEISEFPDGGYYANEFTINGIDFYVTSMRRIER